MNTLKKTMAWILALVFVFSAVPVYAEDSTAVAEEVPAYYFSSKESDKLPVVFFDEGKDIPYLSGATIAEMLMKLASDVGDTNYKLEYGYATYKDLDEAGLLSMGTDADPDCEVFFMQRENGAVVLFDYDGNMIWISDRDLFRVSSYAVSGGDLVFSRGVFYHNDGSVYQDEETKNIPVNLYQRAKHGIYKREGAVIAIMLDDYDIKIELYEGEYYLPLATIADLFLGRIVAYNGQAVFALDGTTPDETVKNDEGLTQKDLYYQPGPRARSEALANFTYHELCLMLDNNYGLKAEHEITEGFDKFFSNSGLADDLCSTDPKVFTDALCQVIYGFFGDLHSSLKAPSSYVGTEYTEPDDNVSITYSQRNRNLKRFKNAREAAGITTDNIIQKGYTEIGDTAFVTFDSFRAASDDYYDQEKWSHFSDYYMQDTISLVIYAHASIHRKDSPIRKVVIDLTCNGGGSLDACTYIASWVLGSADISFENVNTGAQYTTSYWVDVNLDEECTTSDELNVDQLDVYCLVNGVSFSCGNLLPTLFKQDGRVTLIGQTTGGGACVVRNGVTADGTLLTLSDYYRLSIVKNGSFYSIDRGVEPDIPMRKPASFYDRQALVEYLDTIR